jgi:hypothetical protein
LGGGIMILYGAIMLFVGAVLFFLSRRVTVDFNLSTIGLFVLIGASLVHILFARNRIQ